MKLFQILSLSLGWVAIGVRAEGWVDPIQETVLENAHVRMVFESGHGGLASLVDKASGMEHLHRVEGRHALWEIRLTQDHDSRSLASTLYPYSTASVTTESGFQCATFRWAGLPLGVGNADGSVEVRVKLPQDSGIAEWTIRVENASSTWGLGSVDFPKVNGFLEAGAYDLAGALGHTESWGSLYRGFTGRLEKRYPDGWRGMSTQFLCASRGSNSIYLAAHDPRAWFKEFTIEPGNEFFIRTHAENAGVAGSGYQAPYPAMLGVYRGDWLTGCKVYRKFAVTAPWASQGKVSKGKAVLRAGTDMGLWLREWSWTKDGVGDYESLIRQVKEAQDFFGVPLGFHWYNWQVADFDTKYPHFFPAKPGADKLARGMVERGWVVMPYINGRIVDQAVPDFNDLVPFTAKSAEGEFYTERYNNEVKQAVMCPSTRFWQKKVVSNVSQLITGLGVNAVYIDQIAAAPPCLCFDRTHGHPLGGGSWWVDAYREMLKQVRVMARTNGRQVLITTECTSEPYMDGVDGMLVVTERSRCSIPVLPAVYAGYTLYFGAAEGALENCSNNQWPVELGRDFIWGCQNGWFGFSLFRPEHASQKAYLRTLAQARVAACKYLGEGEMVALLDDGSRSDYQDVPWVQGSLWKSDDGSLGLVIANCRAQKSTLSYVLDPKTYGLNSDGGTRCVRIHPSGGVAVNLPPGVIRFEEVLEPLEVRVLSITPAVAP